jgi:PAS domain S-box-containing protein
VTWHELQLPARPSLLWKDVRVRFGLFALAWGLVSIHWLTWRALPFQAALAAAVLWHGLRRERLLQRTEAVEEELRDAKERYRSLVETLPLATYVDRPGDAPGVAWVSPQIAAITSFGPEEWIADANLFEKVLHPDDRERVLEEMARVKVTGGAIDHEYRLVRRDGSIVWIHDSAVALDADGVWYIRGFIIDVTARRAAEVELEAQNEQLRQLDRLKDEFVALVSHELRTPLTSIRGYLELMGEDANLTDEQTHFLETIDRNAQRLQRVVGDLLFCAQVEAGKLTLERGAVDVDAVVRDSVHAGQPAANAKSIVLTAELGVRDPIAGDRARLAQVLDNVVSNAVKFTPDGGRVTVSTRSVVDELLITIEDTGMGIPADELPRLFQRFFRTERATATAIPGSGLGLAIAKAIVDGHGGRIGVESDDGVGTTFRIFLPAASYVESPASDHMATAIHGTPITSV